MTPAQALAIKRVALAHCRRRGAKQVVGRDRARHHAIERSRSPMSQKMVLDWRREHGYSIGTAVDKAFAGYHARRRDWERFRNKVERLAA